MSKTFKLTKSLYLKEANLKDNDFIFKLRTNKKLSKFINPTSTNKNDQIIWFKKYLIRRKNKKEFYFIFQLNKKNIGFARIIHVKKDTFHFGGWILDKNTKPWISLESCLAIFEYAFNILLYKDCLLWINLKNIKVIKYHKSLGSTYVKKTNKEVFLKFTKKKYYKLKEKFNYFY